MKRVIVVFASIFLFACNEGSNDDVVEENEFVYIASGRTQCNDDGITYDESAQVLIESGVDVMSTQCGSITGFGMAAVCGNLTFEIIAHEIRIENVVDAEGLGYKSISEIIDEEHQIAYELSECEDI